MGDSEDIIGPVAVSDIAESIELHLLARLKECRGSTNAYRGSTRLAAGNEPAVIYAQVCVSGLRADTLSYCRGATAIFSDSLNTGRLICRFHAVVTWIHLKETVGYHFARTSCRLLVCILVKPVITTVLPFNGHLSDLNSRSARCIWTMNLSRKGPRYRRPHSIRRPS